MKGTRKYWRELINDGVIYFTACCPYMAYSIYSQVVVVVVVVVLSVCVYLFNVGAGFFNGRTLVPDRDIRRADRNCLASS